jgi:outer membrane receptor protein involved in Fe transport
MKDALRLCFAFLFGGVLATTHGARAQGSPAVPTPAPVQEQIVVSATRGPEIETEIPGQATVIRGEDLRRENVRTVADALQDVVGLDTGLGSDNGTRLPNVGLWGLKEFDALLVMVDGVPIGGPFNPSLSQINIDDVDHIEIVKGPQGTLYGVSAFAGMIQIFTKEASPGTHVSLSGGSFSDWRGSVSTTLPLGEARLRVFGNVARANGWQDRTDFKDDRLGLRLDTPLAGGKLAVTFDAYRNTQFFGSPLPVDPPSGETLAGFQADRNYEVGGARLDHRLYSLTTNYVRPLSSAVTLENTLSITRDDQISVRSFIDGVDGNTATAAGVAIYPVETDFYGDVHLAATFEAAGHHRLVGGAALTWGRTTADGMGFDINLQIDPVIVPDLSNTPAGDHRSFNDRRTFVGLYVNDEWTPVRFLTVTAGARYDHVSESLFAQGQEVGAPAPDISEDSRTDGKWSGGVSALARLLTGHKGAVNDINVYVAAKSAFKPAAPNLTEAESAVILEPERTRSGEIGVKTRWLDRQLSFDASFFHMNFENLVVSTVGPDGNPELVNAGEERFQGAELEVGFHPSALPDLSVMAGYAHHDATYVHFSFIDPDLGPQNADGQRLELVPRDLWNGKVSWHPARGLGAWAAVRHQNQRPFDKINEAYMPSFFEWDAGLSWSFAHARASIVGRNLGNSRHFVAESEIGDAQLYVAPPRRFMADLTIDF